jgi:hypothetical protein
MAVASLYSISDALSTVAIGILPVFPALYLLDPSATTIGLFGLGAVGLTTSLGSQMARQYYEYGYPKLRHEDTREWGNRSPSYLYTALSAAVITSTTMSTVLGTLLLPVGVPAAAAAAVLYPAVDQELGGLRWYLSPQLLAVSLVAWLVADEAATPAATDLDPLATTDFRSVFNPGSGPQSR